MDLPSSDRNLLLGIIALQMDFIDREGLIAAMHAWTLEKERPLGEILVERGDLDPSDREVLESLVDRHVTRHGGDPAESLASVDPAEPIRSALRPIDDDAVRQSLSRLGKACTMPTSDRDRTVTYRAAAALSGGRYQVIHLHDEGGLGRVFLARDTEIDREVALKELKADRTWDDQSRARFVREAEITGNLEHPGVVPVYGKGRHDDGRPYYAMRFVRGETFKSAIDRFHKELGSGADPGARRREFQGLLRRFLVVCETMAYAHHRGVIHRDLKPRNILLGPYGETLIADWGLAKVVGVDREFASRAEALRLASGVAVEPTLAGARFGTPEYMSPEQARGEVDRLGPATDIYSLGATLFYLLSGQHMVGGGDPGEVLARVGRGEVRRPREVDPDIDRALEAVCLKATALDADRRYPSCRALADDLERWLADQPVSAFPEPITTRVARAVRRNKQLVASAAALSVAAVAGLLWHDRMLARENERVDVAYRQVKLANEHAGIARDRATQQLLTTRLALRDQFELVSNGLAALHGSERLREQHAGVMLELYGSLRRAYPNDAAIRYEMAEVYRILAMVRRMTRQRDGALTCYREAADLYGGLLADSDQKYPALRGLVQIHTDRGELHRMSGRTREAEADYGLALEYCKGLEDDPEPAFYRARLGPILINRSENRMVQGRHAEAFADADEAVRVLSAPRTTADGEESRWYLAMALTDRAVARRGEAEHPAAAADFERALEVLERIPATSVYRRDADCQCAVIASRHGDLLQAGRQAGAAAPRYARAATILRGLRSAHADVPYYREELAIALTGLARAILVGGDAARAESTVTEAIALLRELAKAEPDNAQYHSLHARALLAGARASSARDRPEEARRQTAEATSCLRRALDLNPERPADRDELSRIEPPPDNPPAPAPNVGNSPKGSGASSSTPKPGAIAGAASDQKY
jgi:serine/threonine-protein kinase